jgi:hypothetical protein
VFTGHFAVALAGAAIARRVPMGLLIGAAFAADLVEGGVAAAYVVDPTRAWSHSIPATALAGGLLALAWRIAGGSWREGAVVFLASLSHTLLDFITSLKTIWPGLPPAGLRLYGRPYPEAALEVFVSIIAWAAWRCSLPAARQSSTPVWIMLAVLVIAQAALLAHVTIFGPGAESGALSKFVR